MIDKAKLPKAIKDKYQVSNETFIRVAKANPKDKIEVEIGDSKQPDFKPQVKVQRWDNEVNLSFRLKDDGAEQETVDTVADKIVWKKGKREVRFYDLPESETLPEGGYEFEVVLLEKPATNVVEFSLNTKGLDFFYQPALTPEEIEHGSDRPENVVGSYAVYASEKKTNWVGGKEYKTGKAGHIFRPQVEDANGNKVWGKLNVDTKKGILSVTIPQEFLDSAVYPVKHAAGLTFGYTSAGGSSRSITTGGTMAGSSYVIPEDGIVSKLTIYGSYNATFGSANFKAVITDTSYNIVSNGISNAATLATSLSWRDATMGTPPVLASGEYVLCAVFQGTSEVFRYDSTPTVNYGGRDLSNSYASPTSPTDMDTAYKVTHSIYATYIASSGFPVRKSVTDTDIASSLTSHVVNMPPTVNAGDRLIAIAHYRNAGTWTTVPTDWANLAEQAGGGSVGEMAIFEKIADGTEGGGTATWITGTGTTAAWQVIRISGAHASTASEVTTTSGDSSSADPPSLTASWGAENNLWIAVAGHSAASATAFSAAPLGFAGFALNGASSGGAACSIAHGYDTSAVATYNPGPFTPSGSNRWWSAATIAVRPASGAAFFPRFNLIPQQAINRAATY